MISINLFSIYIYNECLINCTVWKQDLSNKLSISIEVISEC